MIAKRASRSSTPREAPAGVISRFVHSVDRSENGRGRPGIMSREVAGQLLSPSGWTVLTQQLPALSAALAYRTIFSLVPVLVIGLMVIGAYAEEKEISNALTRVIQFAGLDQVAVDAQSVEQSPVDPDQDAAPAPAAEPGDEPDRAAVGSQRLDEWIASLVKQVRSIPFRTIGFIGLAALIYAAMSMLVEIERAFNQIYRVPSGRSWWSRITRYWTLLTLGSIGLFATFYATDRFMSRFDRPEPPPQSINEVLTEATGTPPEPGVAQSQALTQATRQPAQPSSARPAPPAETKAADGRVFSIKAVLGYAVTVLISTGFLMVIYSVVPNARVRPMSALSGAFVAALLWEAAKWAFAFYVKSAGYTKLYGALALLPLFLLWIYVAWMIVLLGLFISYTIQSRGVRPVTVLSDGRTSIVDPASILLVAGAIARAFGSGRSITEAEIAKTTGLEQAVVVSMVEAMVARGLVHRIATGDDEDRFSLARPPEAIEAAECLTVAADLVEPSTERSSAPGTDVSLVSAVQPLQEARVRAAKGRTLAEFVGKSGRGDQAVAGPASPPAADLPGADLPLRPTPVEPA
ncbi:MAG: YihY family inner membrane protein [Phycisphaerales bacterium]|nr:YihY family inner membrane protein [Phycisphaerales bacterium]